MRLGLAALCGVVAMALLYFREQQLLVERSGGPRVAVLIAKEEIKAGDRVTPENLGVQEVPRAYLHVSAIANTDQDKIVGRKVYKRIRQNQPLLWTEFDPPERERVNETLAKGMRLTPITVGEHLAKSRFLAPGDFIDVLVHFNLGSDRGSVTMTLLQHVQVLEIIQNVAMVALTPEQMEQVVFARAHGTLTFAVRNREDIEKHELPSATFQTLLGAFAPVPLPTINGGAPPGTVPGAAAPGAGASATGGAQGSASTGGARGGSAFGLAGLLSATKQTAAEAGRAGASAKAPAAEQPEEKRRSHADKRERN